MRNLALMCVLAGVAVALLAAGGGKPSVSTYTDKRDGKIYKTVKIGTQVWMAENLDYAAEGSVYYGEGGKVYMGYGKDDKKLSPDEIQANGAKYGRLYSWEAAVKACPAEWHLATDAEWKTLVDYAGGKSTAGKKLKSVRGWSNYKEKSGNGTDNYGFSALPGGSGDRQGFFMNAGNVGSWWSATVRRDVSSAWSQLMYYDDNKAISGIGPKSGLSSVRCVQNMVPVGTANTPKTPDTAAFAPDTDNAFTDNRDGKTYKAIRIGTQVWMAENMNYAADMSRCYQNNPEICEKYGRLYNWAAARQACPRGYHLPTDAEWTTLVDYAGGEDEAGRKLKSTAGWYKKGAGTDEYGFSALPSGHGLGGGFFHGAVLYGVWWSATESDAGNAWRRSMDCSNEAVFNTDESKSFWFSVRCVQNMVSIPASMPKMPDTKAFTHDTSNTFTDSRDGKTYRKVTIGKQVWMAGNLNYNAEGSKCYGEDGKVRTYDQYGESMETTLSNAETQANCANYGRLYNWATARQACPAGWHLPLDDEWTALENFVGDSSTAATKLKSTSGWVDYGNGTDEYGFFALPCGYGYGRSDAIFSSAGENGSWWSATEYNAGAAWYRSMYDNKKPVDRYYCGKSYLFSVRCVKDD